MEARGELCADGGDMNDIDGGGEDGELAHFSVCDADGGDAQSDDGDENGDDGIHVGDDEDDGEGVDKLEDEVEVMLVLPMVIVKTMLKTMTMTTKAPVI